MSKLKAIGGKYKGVELYVKANGLTSYHIKYKDLEGKTKREKVGDSYKFLLYFRVYYNI